MSPRRARGRAHTLRLGTVVILKIKRLALALLHLAADDVVVLAVGEALVAPEVALPALADDLERVVVACRHFVAAGREVAVARLGVALAVGLWVEVYVEYELFARIRWVLVSTMLRGVWVGRQDHKQMRGFRVREGETWMGLTPSTVVAARKRPETTCRRRILV